MRKIKIFGLVGFAKAGKSTFLDIFKKEFGAEEVMLANHLKNTSSDVFLIPRSHFDDQSIKEVPFKTPIELTSGHILDICRRFDISEDVAMSSLAMKHVGTMLTSPRHIAQYIGSELLRSLDSDIHIKTAIRKMNESSSEIFVVSDIRFMNELEAFSKYDNFTSVAIKRDAVAPKDLKKVHQSEAAIPSIQERCNFILENNTTKEEYDLKVAHFGFNEIVMPEEYDKANVIHMASNYEDLDSGDSAGEVA